MTGTSSPSAAALFRDARLASRSAGGAVATLTCPTAGAWCCGPHVQPDASPRRISTRSWFLKTEPGAVPVELLELCCEVVLVKRCGSHLPPSTSRPEIVEEFDSPAFHAHCGKRFENGNPTSRNSNLRRWPNTPSIAAKTILVEHDITLDLYQQLRAERCLGTAPPTDSLGSI
jgi:hypothetical protein